MTTLPQSALDAFTTLEQFRDYFAGIPEERWCERRFENDAGQCCARGHLGERDEPSETPAIVFRLATLLGSTDTALALINDGSHERFPQPTPRARILAAIEEAIERRDGKL